MTAPWTGEEEQYIRREAALLAANPPAQAHQWTNLIMLEALATLDAARAEAKRLRGTEQAVRKYGQHLAGCPRHGATHQYTEAYRCGLDAALAATPAATAPCKCPPELCAHQPSPVASPDPARAVVEAAVADDLRDQGWSVAVHNDYKVGGTPYTFWLLTKDGRAVKGEGRTDAEALNVARAAVAALGRTT